MNLREILVKSQRKSTPKISKVHIQPSIVEEQTTNIENGGVGLTNGRNIRPLSRSSNTSMDSTGSNHIHDQEVALGANVPNGEVSHVTSGVDHVTSSDVTSTTVANGENESVKQNGRPNDLPGLRDSIDFSEPLSQETEPPPRAIDSSHKTITTSTSIDAIPTKSRDLESLSQDEDMPIPKGKLLARRQTYHTGMLPNASQRASLANSLSTIANSPSTRRYTNVAGQPQGRTMSISGGSVMGSLRGIQLRKSTSHSLSVKQRSRKTSTSAVVSPTHKPNLKLVKIVLAGNDILVSHTAKAYAYLRMEEPNLFSGLEMRFYHVPLSRASAIHGIDIGGTSLYSATSQNPDLPEPLFEQVDMSGNDVHIGRFLAHMDSWYERNLMIAAHHLLRILPSVSYLLNCMYLILLYQNVRPRFAINRTYLVYCTCTHIATVTVE